VGAGNEFPLNFQYLSIIQCFTNIDYQKTTNKQIGQNEIARFHGPHRWLCYAPGALLGFGAVVHGLTTPGGELPVVSGDQPLGAAIQSANVGLSWLVGRGWLVKVINKNHWNLGLFFLRL